MAIYAIGDVQGCYDELMALLDQIDFDAEKDHLWFTGDLVNRGPKSLDVLRYVKGLAERAITVLGNHDLHLLAVAQGSSELRKDDTLDEVLAAADRDDLLDWLRHCPLLYHNKEWNYTLVHAGLPPQWDLKQAKACARELEDTLRGAEFKPFLDNMYGNKPKRWKPSLMGWERLRYITNSLTRLRYVDTSGALSLKAKGPPGTQPPDCVPWFQAPKRKWTETTVVFGHWSTLPYMADHNVIGLDTGCLWGGELTAVRLDVAKGLPVLRSSVSCQGQRAPSGY